MLTGAGQRLLGTNCSFNQKALKEQIVLLNILPVTEQESINPD